MNYEPHVSSEKQGVRIPDGKRTGCLPRTSRFGDLFPPAAENIPIVPRSQWAALAKPNSLRPYVKTILDQDGVGCHDDKTEVLTEIGWQPWASYDQSSALGTINPLTHALEFQVPTAIHAYDYEGPLCYREHRSMSMAVTPNHRMYLRRWNEAERRLNTHYDIRTADKIGWYAGLLASPSGFVGTEVESVRIGNRVYSGDDFIALVSLVASDGWAGGTESTKSRVSFCCFRDDRAEMVKALAHRVGFNEQSNRPGVWVQRNPELAEWMRANVYTSAELHAIRKRVPAFVKCVSSRQVGVFLDFYGDQHIEHGRRAFYTSSPQMADDLQELILRIGLRAGICKHKPRSTTFSDGRRIEAANVNQSYTISEWTGDNLSLESKKIGHDHYRGMVYCATVPNSLLVTRRDGKVLISGNSCATEGAAQAVMIARAVAGLPHVELNPWFIYHTTSGGRDSGSSIDENLRFIRENGIAPMSVWPREKGWRAKPSAEAVEAAKEFRGIEVYDISSIDEMVSALLTGFAVVWGANGHCVTKVEHLDDGKGLDVNSWGKDWGDGGFGVWTSYRGVQWGYGAWALRCVTQR